ncbi:hypothetical protein [Paractinoplanes hotanensis]|uniref:Uncharacterized protein n=1 Tax=Paractinoplanes hotanensis TaxID=2906497 RepID=A0ABT0YDW5_9ACTN|nr:hypothetical protein [Actinoplanes hotanensis]MCM4084252.1 hypothetical protein [Actinoplanes hotanensis]
MRTLRPATERRRKHVTHLGSLGAHLYAEPGDFGRPDSWWYSGYAQMTMCPRS